ncbi:hypothetical protein MCA2631 [Methylococcus capsulatus str. Bath]|uniref:Uncharacterized protein n=1 Tax=Methylococcus capsulatus (strain ATCC 33009 / NCIMB 11132 / Bath) TaxID=243233 RepID=Q604B5_METCA|nr:hypothetical protein MCA2631 [Methylococcus capsulatus str. Bath]
MASGSYHGPQRKTENREALSGRERRSDGVRVRKAPPGNRANIGVAGEKKGQPRTVGLGVLVEAAGIEPASANPLPSVLHAYPLY